MVGLRMAKRWLGLALVVGSIGFVQVALADLAPPPAPKVPTPGPAELAPGAYKCTFTQGEYKYPAFRCVITKQMTAAGTAKFGLEKLTGSQRIRGTVTPTATGFRFSGKYFCPYGDCTEATEGDFRRTGRDEYQGSLKTSTGVTRVKLYK